MTTNSIEQPNSFAEAPASSFAQAYARYTETRSAIDAACHSGEAENDDCFNALYRAHSDAIDRAMFTPAERPGDIARKLEIYQREDMEGWRTGKAALTMISQDAIYFDEHAAAGA